MGRFRVRAGSGMALLAAVAVVAVPAAGGAHRAKQPEAGKPRMKDGCARIESKLPTYADWPRVHSRIKSDKKVEARVRSILSKLSLAEKVGQMTQPEITTITPAQVAEYHIGSVLNGGGAWPGANKHASQADWLKLADAYWAASKQGNKAGVPAIWGIDAVHGNSNIFGATLFPHNIGLGAAHDPCLIRDVQAATARQVRATGQDWAFAPTLAVVRDDRWGRTYEGFSEDPRITRAYGYEAIRGLQGHSRHGIGSDGVIGTAKHFIGDGGTEGGKDQGVNASTEAQMINIHGQGYYGALAAGSQSVMVSFNSWTNAEQGIAEGKLHGSTKALTEILKGKMGFDGLVVSDWNGIGQVPGCTNASCPQAINAGIDVVMVPQDWKAFIANTIEQVDQGQIPMERIDDAVTRILRVKLRTGLMDQPKPSAREHATDGSALQEPALARRAVRESQVLLKNENKLLPLPQSSKVLVVGKSADSLQNQTGGWSLTWQGTGNTNADFPNGTSILGGLRNALGTDDVTFRETGEGVDPSQYDAVIAVIGETPYAEGNGDIGKRSLEHARLYPQDLAVLDRVSGKGAPVATVFVAGRPLYVNKELNRSDAFVAAWLPGTEGDGVADLLVKGRKTGKGYTGKLSYSWPASPCQTPLNAGDEDYAPLFKLGYGLANGQKATVPQLPEESVARCVDSGGGGHGDRGPRAVRPPGRRPVQELHRLTGQLGRHRAGQQPERPGGGAHEHRGALDGRQRPAGRAQDHLEGRRGAVLHPVPGAGPAALAQRRRRDRLGHDHHQGAHGPDRDQRALHVPVLLRRADHEGPRRPRRRGQAHDQDPRVLPRQRGARVRPHQHAVPDLHRGRAGGGVRERPLGAGGGEGRGRAQLR